MTEDPDSVEELFSNQASEYDDQTEWRQNEKILGCLKDFIGQGGGIAVDLGTGTGLVANYISPSFKMVAGVDISFQMLQKAKSRIEYLLQGDIAELPFKSASIDFCTMRQVLHYLENERPVLEEINRIVKPRGSIVLADVIVDDEKDIQWWRELKAAVQPLRKRVYSRSSHKALLDIIGFGITRQRIVQLWRKDSWDVFLRRIPADSPDRAKVSTMLQKAVAGDVNFPVRTDRSGVQYVQYWSITRADRLLS